jgi:hypothetical protein
MSSIGKELRGALLAVLALAPATAHAQAAYRTVVIFGDTQTAVNGGAAQYSDFSQQIDWVIANKYTENIDFVLHVGDIIDTGTFLPLPVACQGAPSVPGSTCSSVGNPCPLPPNGCFTAADGAGGSICLSCAGIRAAVDNQWASFNAQWSRFEPDVAAGWEGIPYAIVRGNHDNIGVAMPNDVDTVGFNQYYGEAQMEALEASFVGLDRSYEHVETYASSTEGNGNAWRFDLGGRPVIVVGPSYEGGRNISQEQIDWTIGVFGDNADTAGVLLVHDAIEYSQIHQQVVSAMPTVAPNLILAAQGHIRQDIKSIQDIQGFQVIRTVSDWSRTPSPGGSYFALLRFYLDPGLDDEVEAFSYSPVLDVVVPDPSATIVKQSFPVPVPEPSVWSLRIAGLAGLFLLWRRRGP